MPTFQHSELLPEHEILQNKIPALTEKANQGSNPEKKQTEHGMKLPDQRLEALLYVVNSAVGQSFGEGQGRVTYSNQRATRFG
jgi:hypothetical protein